MGVAHGRADCRRWIVTVGQWKSANERAHGEQGQSEATSGQPRWCSNKQQHVHSLALAPSSRLSDIFKSSSFDGSQNTCNATRMCNALYHAHVHVPIDIARRVTLCPKGPVHSPATSHGCVCNVDEMRPAMSSSVGASVSNEAGEVSTAGR